MKTLSQLLDDLQIEEAKKEKIMSEACHVVINKITNIFGIIYLSETMTKEEKKQIESELLIINEFLKA